FIDGLERTNGGHKVAIEFRQHQLGNSIEMNLEGHDLVGQGLFVVVLGEADIKGFVIALLEADQLVFEAGNETIGTHAQGLGLGAGAGHGLAAVGAVKVKVDLVAQLGRLLGVQASSFAAAQVLDSPVNLGRLDFDLGSLEADFLVVAQLDFWHQFNGN